METFDNLREMSDEDLDTLRVAVLNEQERRIQLETIPGQITALVKQYAAGGGDPSTLTLNPEES